VLRPVQLVTRGGITGTCGAWYAYADALTAVDAACPEFAQQWARWYGQSWQQFTAHVGNDPAEAYDRWEAQQQGTAGTQ
jgi:hypothetical protein